MEIKTKHLVILTLLTGITIMTIKRKPFNVRNNNPLNIRVNKAFTWNGQIGQNNGFVVFDTLENGFRAAYKTLMTYRVRHELITIEQILNRWAPEEENPTSSYIDYLADALQQSPNEQITMEQYPELILAMSVFEGAKGRFAYNINQVNSGVALAI